MYNDTRLNFRTFHGPSREWYQPPEEPECECEEGEDICMKCASEKYDEDYMKDPDRKRDERIDREMDKDYWDDWEDCRD